MQTRLLVVDDHLLFAEALAARLSAEPDMQVVGIATNTRAAEELARRSSPDVVTVDIDLGDENGIDLLVRLRAAVPEATTVVVSCMEDVRLVSAAVRAGASGWLEKDGPTERLVTALRGVTAGETWIPPRLLTSVLADLLSDQRVHQTVDVRLQRLTERERDVVRLMVDGLDTRQIASRLYLSVNTVRSHIQNALTKLGAHSRLEAVALVRQAGVGSRYEG